MSWFHSYRFHVDDNQRRRASASVFRGATLFTARRLQSSASVGLPVTLRLAEGATPEAQCQMLAHPFPWERTWRTLADRAASRVPDLRPGVPDLELLCS